MMDKQRETEKCLLGQKGHDHGLVNDDKIFIATLARHVPLSILISDYDVVSPDRIALRSYMYSSSWSNHLS